jgi:predicted secreted protein
MPSVVLRPRWFVWPLLVAAAGTLASAADEASSLYVRIDQLSEARAGGPLAAQASDVEFLRRVYLDLAGRVPAVDEARAFLADTAADKREKLIDALLASDNHVRRMTQVFNVMLMERLGDHADWQKFLHESFQTNKPWDQLVREILNPNPDDEATRGSALWYTKRLEHYGENPVDIPGLVRDVGRHFLGIDVQCAQCHDHLFVEEYKQEFYQGLFAFVGQATIRQDVKFPAIGLTPVSKKVEFMSVFVQKPLAVGPKLPGGPEVEIPTFDKGQEFEQPPDKKTKFPGVPKFNTLKILAEQLPRPENSLFTRNIANRLWWLMMGRGIVHPLDLHHAGNPPSHPELLNLLASELAAHQFDMRWLIREIALSQTYQRSSAMAGEAGAEAPPQSYRAALEKPLSSEQMLASIRQALGDEKPLATVESDKNWTKWQGEFDKALANPAREPEVGHNPTVKAALFLMHDTTLLGWLKPEGDNLMARLLRHDDADKLAGELYLAVLARQPSDDEKTSVAEYLSPRADRRERVIGNLVWSLIASNEFCANH